MVMIDSGFLSSIGVGLDIVGAYFLAQGLMVKNLENTVIESSDYMDGNPYRIRSAIHQRIDAMAGFVLLAFGFGSQFIVNLSFIPKGEDNLLPQSIALLALIFLLTLSIVRPIKRDQSRKVIIERFPVRTSLELSSKAGIKSKEQLLEAAKFYGEAIEVKRKHNETIDQYVKRVIEAYHPHTSS